MAPQTCHCKGRTLKYKYICQATQSSKIGSIPAPGDGPPAIIHILGCCRKQLGGNCSLQSCRRYIFVSFFGDSCKGHIRERVALLCFLAGLQHTLWLATPLVRTTEKRRWILLCTRVSWLSAPGAAPAACWKVCTQPTLDRGNCKMPGLRDKTRLCLNESDLSGPSTTTETEANRVYSEG